MKGGTKEACIKAREFLTHVMKQGDQLQAPLSCISSDEFEKTVKILITFAFN